MFLITIVLLDHPRCPQLAPLNFTIATFPSPILQVYLKFLAASSVFLWLLNTLVLFHLCFGKWFLLVAGFRDLKKISLNSLIISHTTLSLVSFSIFFLFCFQISELLCSSSDTHQAHLLTVLLF